MRTFLIILAIILLTALGWSGWIRDTVGFFDEWYYDIKIGDARNDGVKRIYCSTGYEGHIVEWSFDQGSWSMVDCCNIPGSSYNQIPNIWIGDGRMEGINRIYGACYTGRVFEITYSGGLWIIDSLDNGPYVGLTGGTPRNDDTTRVCVSGVSTRVREYTWNGASWDTVYVSSGG